MGNGLAGGGAGGALGLMQLPVVTRTAEGILRTIDDGLRESALALGAPQWRSVVQVVLPTARSGLITASILGVARAIGETAPVLLTAFGNSSINWNPFSGCLLYPFDAAHDTTRLCPYVAATHKTKNT